MDRLGLKPRYNSRGKDSPQEMILPSSALDPGAKGFPPSPKMKPSISTASERLACQDTTNVLAFLLVLSRHWPIPGIPVTQNVEARRSPVQGVPKKKLQQTFANRVYVCRLLKSKCHETLHDDINNSKDFTCSSE